MMEIYHRAKAEAHYTASEFFKMLIRNRGVHTAKKLVNAREQSIGYANLYLKGRLDLTVEALIVDNQKWWPLFEEGDISNSRKRLALNNYVSRNQKLA